MSTLRLRPYARLLNMLGDQLIKNERIALIELIKNSFDADASWVKVSFNGFTDDFQIQPQSTIVIEDDGTGMSRTTVERHFVNPATPIKLLAKKKNSRTKKGRVIQGEKGIGRFALLKLGRKISITTRVEGEPQEQQLTLDLSGYDDDLVAPKIDEKKKESDQKKKTGDHKKKGDEDQALFLDELTAELGEIEPAVAIQAQEVGVGARKISRAAHGTRIEVSHLIGSWSRSKVEKVFQDIARLQSLVDLIPEPDSPPLPEFEAAIYRDDALEPFSADYQERLTALVSDHSVFRIENGRFDQLSNRFSFRLNGIEQTLDLADPSVRGLGAFRRHFGKGAQATEMKCGSFAFSFYVFDFSNDAVGRYQLNEDDRDLIREHRIYLYRDGIRVYPYGDPDDDWLQIDVKRGTIKASEFLSNDQVVGFVRITQAENPKLTDKTSREGLIDTGRPTADFLFLLQLFLAWIRQKPYGDYRRKLTVAHDLEVFKKEMVADAFSRAIAAAADDPKVLGPLSEAQSLYTAERSYLVHRAETTEHLAGVGLSVETASHDLMLAMQRVLGVIDALLVESERPGIIDKSYLGRELTMIRGSLSFVHSQLKDLRLLFRSTKQRRKDIKIVDLVRRVQRLFQSALDRAKILTDVVEVGPPLIGKTTDAVVLQVLLNLFDNSLYWLQGVSGDRRIRIELNGTDGTLVFSDSGPGIRKEDASYVFDPFYSGKGDEGRGLGLYIARQLLERQEFSIQLADLKSHRHLKGANFVVSFVRDGER